MENQNPSTLDYQTPRPALLSPTADDRGTLKTLAIFQIGLGGLDALTGVMLIFSGVPPRIPFALITVFGILLLSGYFMWTRRYRVFSLVVSTLMCLFFPVGTIIGIWTLIVLSKRGVVAIYRDSSDGPKDITATNRG